MKLEHHKVPSCMCRRLALMLTACLICLSPVLAQSPLNLPSWFWNPPGNPDTKTAVGYSRPYYYPASSYDEAFEDAALRLWQDQECTIRAAMGSVTTGPETMSMGGIADIQSDTTGFSIFKDGLVRIDSCWSEELVLMFVGTKQVKVTRTLIPPPAEVLTYPNSDNYIIAKSTAEAYHFKTSSWQAAERYARRNLALAANSQIRSLRSTQNLRMRKVITIESTVHFYNISTLGRFVDAATGACIVEIGVNRNDISIVEH
ncbi:MAG: hypothetical protein V2A56_05930 [bacterium]